jgi:hypothetical protein
MTSELFNAGDRVHIAEMERDGHTFEEAHGTVDRDTGGAVVHVQLDGQSYRYPHEIPAIPRELVTLVESDEDDEPEEDDDEELTDLGDVIERHGFKIIPVYVDSFDGDPTGQLDYDRYDVLMIIETGGNMYGGAENPTKRTMLYKGYGQSHSNSLPQTGGVLMPPEAEEVITDLLNNASIPVNYDSAQEWAKDMSVSGEPEEIEARWAALVAFRKELTEFLGDAYGEFVNAL